MAHNLLYIGSYDQDTDQYTQGVLRQSGDYLHHEELEPNKHVKLLTLMPLLFLSQSQPGMSR